MLDDGVVSDSVLCVCTIVYYCGLCLLIVVLVWLCFKLLGYDISLVYGYLDWFTDNELGLCGLL